MQGNMRSRRIVLANERVGATVTARELLDKAANDIDAGLSKDPELQARMMQVMGRAYSDLGFYPRAQLLFEQSIKKLADR